mgnify:CR=1 FL=1
MTKVHLLRFQQIYKKLSILYALRNRNFQKRRVIMQTLKFELKPIGPTAANIEKWHEVIGRMRGHEFHCTHAEAFVKHVWRSSDMLDR